MVTNPDEPSGVHGDSDRGKLYGHQPCPFHTQLPWKWSMIVWERKGGPNTIKQLSINIRQLSHVRYYNGSICGSAWALAGDELPMTVCTVSPSQPFQNNNRRQIQCTRCLRFTNHIIWEGWAKKPPMNFPRIWIWSFKGLEELVSILVSEDKTHSVLQLN